MHIEVKVSWRQSYHVCDCTLLKQAIFSSATLEFKLLTKHASIHAEARDNDGKTPLHHACDMGHVEIIQYLVENVKCDVGEPIK